MANKVNVVSAILTPEQRAAVLRAFTPAYPDVFAFQMTWTYRVTEEFQFPRQPVIMVLDGYHCGENADAATGYLSSPADELWSERLCPDGTYVHVTLSTRPGASPVEAGLINPRKIWRIAEPLRLSVIMKRRHATTLRPERRETA